jgi:hypothetical protein
MRRVVIFRMTLPRRAAANGLRHSRGPGNYQEAHLGMRTRASSNITLRVLGHGDLRAQQIVQGYQAHDLPLDPVQHHHKLRV